MGDMGPLARRRDLESWRQFVRTHGHAIAACPPLLSALAVDDPRPTPVGRAATAWLARRHGRFVLRRVNRPRQSGTPSLTIATGATAPRLWFAPDGLVLITEDDGIQEVWDLRTGRRQALTEDPGFTHAFRRPADWILVCREFVGFSAGGQQWRKGWGAVQVDVPRVEALAARGVSSRRQGTARSSCDSSATGSVS